MEYSRSLVFLCIYYLFACFSSRANGMSFSLDVASDKRGSMWKIQGSTEYIEDGTSLRDRFPQYFPDRFEFAGLDLAKGIWVVLPAPTTDCSNWIEDSDELDSSESSWLGSSLGSLFSEKTNTTNDDAKKVTTSTRSPKTKSTTTTTEKPLCYKSSNATFKATMKAQLLASTTIRYCFGGNAVIHVGGGRDSKKPFEMKANGQKLNQWIEETVPLDSGSMILEANVEGKGDYILIDKITIDTMVPTTARPTTMKPTSTSTKSPEPAPASGQGRTGVALNFFMPLFALFILSSFIFKM